MNKLICNRNSFSTLSNEQQNQTAFIKLNKRISNITTQIFQGMDEMEFDPSISSQVIINFNPNNFSASPFVSQQQNKIILEIPLLFLIEKEDLDLTSPTGLCLKNLLSQRTLSKKDFETLKSIRDFIQNPKKAKKAKKFVLYHELAHIFCGHIFQQKEQLSSKEQEKEADLTAAKFSKETKAAIYLFNILSKHDNTNSPSHPSYKERINYLQTYQASLSSDPTP